MLQSESHQKFRIMEYKRTPGNQSLKANRCTCPAPPITLLNLHHSSPQSRHIRVCVGLSCFSNPLHILSESMFYRIWMRCLLPGPIQQMLENRAKKKAPQECFTVILCLVDHTWRTLVLSGRDSLVSTLSKAKMSVEISCQSR